MADDTLILRGRPADRTPGWVGDPGREATTTLEPPWLAPTADVPGAAETDETMVRAGALRRRLELIAHERDLVARLRRDPDWEALFARPEVRGPIAEKRAIEEALATAPACDADTIAELVDEALERSPFRPPVAVVAGELTFAIDHLARLRATIPLLMPRAAVHADAAMAVSEARALLGGERADVAATTSAIEALWDTHEGTASTQERLKLQVERSLLVRKAIEKSQPFGVELFRGSLQLEGSRALLDAYASPALLATVAIAPRQRVRAFVSLAVAAGSPSRIAGQIVALAKRRST